MSIRDEIRDRLQRRMLFALHPLARGETVQRCMLLTEEMRQLIEGPEGGDEEWEARIGELRADLERFVIGDVLDPKYLFLLYPARDAVWEIRSVRPNPSIRVLGLFAQKDVFVATTVALRESLGGWQSREWKQIKRTACARWRWLFPTYPPMRSITPADLVTGALDGKYFR